jgi:hypothetical protein
VCCQEARPKGILSVVLVVAVIEPIAQHTHVNNPSTTTITTCHLPLPLVIYYYHMIGGGGGGGIWYLVSVSCSMVSM